MQHLPPIPRRRFLQGVGASLSLPAFQSLGATRAESPRRLVCVGNHLGFHPPNFFPKTSGTQYQSSPTLRPLEQHRADLSVFSNLDHDLGGGHNAVHTFLSSVKKEEAAGFPEKNITLDQAAAEHVGSATRFSSLNTSIGDGTSMWRATVCLFA